MATSSVTWCTTPRQSGHFTCSGQRTSGDLRLRDYDGNGLADSDLGAYEENNPGLTPGEVQNLLWTDKTHLAWDALSGAVEYHLYRGTLPASYASFGTC